MTKLVYKNLSQYRYLITEKCFIPFAASATIAAMKAATVEHPFFSIRRDGVFASAEYAWDGATGAFWQSKSLIVPSLVHDIGCQAVNLKMLPRYMRRVFDYEYRQQALKYGVSPLRAEVHYAVISLWGLVPKSEKLAPYSQIGSIELLSK